MAALAVALAGHAGVAQAQAVGGAAPPMYSAIDGNGVDLSSGAFAVSTVDVTIGQPGQGGLIYARSFYKDSWRDAGTGTLHSDAGVYTVSFDGGSGTFTLSGGVYTPDQADGSSLTFNASTQVYTFTTRNGVVAEFSKALAETAPLQANEGKLTSVTLPSGEKTTYAYKTVMVAGVAYNRVQSVTNNLGYQLKYEYALATPTAVGQLPDFRNITRVTGVNNAVDYCDPAADACSFSQAWPYAAYAKPTATTSTVTDPLGGVTRYSYDTGGKITGVKRPTSSTDNLTVGYDASGNVSSVNVGGSVWGYEFLQWEAPFLDAWVTDPASTRWNAASTNMSTGLLSVRFDQLGRLFNYQYDANGRLTRATNPGGEYVQYAYDARGNVTSTTQVAKPGSGLADIVTSATYPATCANPVTCNLPLTTTAANGAVTDYTYDATHGGLTSVTLPAPTGAAPRPWSGVSYTPLYAWYKNSSGSVVQAPTPVYRPTGRSTCITGSSCGWTANEVFANTIYGTPGTANNLLPTVFSAGSGDWALTTMTGVTYDAVGNRLTVDGPLAGTADTVRYRYDAARRQVGVVGPDPDGGGALKHRGVRYGYNADGQVTTVEVVNVNSQSDGDWAAATVQQQQATTYDAQGRPTHQRLITGGATQSLVQYSYDSVGRLDCTALRMNAATFASPPASACTLATAGADGPDRISKNTYDVAGQPTKITTALGTLQQADDVRLTYDARGSVATVADAMGGLTTYEYDGFGRQKKVRYPIASSRTASSTTDYEEVTYDAYGRALQQRRRDGQVFAVGYDQLGRVTTIDAPAGMSDIYYGYDNLNLLSVTAGGQVLTYSYDALGRQLTAGGPLGVVSYQYDLAGRRTRMTWPDAFYVTYDYDVSGAMTAIHQNGASQLVGFTYDDLGRRTSLTRLNGVTTTYGYDASGRLISLSNDLAGTAQDQTYTLNYNAAAQITSRAGSNVAYAPATPAAGTRAYASNGLNQLTTSGSATLSYDGRGNLTSDSVNNYSYDAANRLTGVSGATLSYDPAGRLYQTVGAATTLFGYDGADLIGEYNSSGVLQRRYIHGPGVDEPLVWMENGATDIWRWLTTDQLGSVTAVTNGAGAAIGINSYDEYGVPGAGNVGRFSYTGQTWVPEAGLAHYKARAYAAGLGRFMQPDPVGFGGGMNVYAYAGGDPVNATDPTGLYPMRFCWHAPGPQRTDDGSEIMWGLKCVWGEVPEADTPIPTPEIAGVVTLPDEAALPGCKAALAGFARHGWALPRRLGDGATSEGLGYEYGRLQAHEENDGVAIFVVGAFLGPLFLQAAVGDIAIVGGARVIGLAGAGDKVAKGVGASKKVYDALPPWAKGVIKAGGGAAILAGKKYLRGFAPSATDQASAVNARLQLKESCGF